MSTSQPQRRQCRQRQEEDEDDKRGMLYGAETGNGMSRVLALLRGDNASQTSQKKCPNTVNFLCRHSSQSVIRSAFARYGLCCLVMWLVLIPLC